MTFTYEKAVKVADHYKYLIGKSMNRVGDLIITNVIITPFDEEQRGDYFQEYNLFHNKEDSLIMSGYDDQKVHVEIVAELGSVKIYKMLDKFLRDNEMTNDLFNLEFL